MQLPVANIVEVTESEGPGRRFAIWLQGCPLRCPGCCNPEMLRFDGGTPMEIAEVMRTIQRARRRHQIEGVTLLGGEPFSHAIVACELAEQSQRQGLSVMVFSGFTIEELIAKGESSVDRLLAATDILVDGPYRSDLPESDRRWIGSSNQKIHFLSDLYSRDDPCWRQPNTIEIRVSGGELGVNGFPASGATGLWKRPRPRPMDGS